MLPFSASWLVTCAPEQIWDEMLIEPDDVLSAEAQHLLLLCQDQILALANLAVLNQKWRHACHRCGWRRRRRSCCR